MKQLPAHSVAVTGTPASSVHACIKRIFLSGPNTSTLHPNSLTVLYPTGEFRESMSGVPKFMMIEPVKCPSSSVLRVFWCTWGARKENFRNSTWCVIINPGPLPRTVYPQKPQHCWPVLAQILHWCVLECSDPNVQKSSNSVECTFGAKKQLTKTLPDQMSVCVVYCPCLLVARCASERPVFLVGNDIS